MSKNRTMIDDARWFQAVARGDNALVRLMIVEGVDLDARDEQDRTAFQIASSQKHTDVMTTILAARRLRFLKSLGIEPIDVGDAESDQFRFKVRNRF